MAVDRTCLGLTDNSTLTRFGLRVAQLDITSPVGLSGGLFGAVLAGSIMPDDPACQLHGVGTSSWLLQFDLEAGTLEVGVALPAGVGFRLENDSVALGPSVFRVQPITFTTRPDTDGKFIGAPGQDIAIPLYSLEPRPWLLLPLRQLSVTGTLSKSQNCVGSYNVAGLLPSNGCEPDDTHEQFVTGGAISAYINLEEADTVISALGETLCAILSGDAIQYGTLGPNNVTVCKRDSANNILFRGDWCSASNTENDCQDSVRVDAQFAASSVLIIK